ncbi:MAG: hypothetical protein AUJ72_06135 [Candidatus Omnitrophica bacterium CG1_02_46_14]|nr:MAG: hypothetical protein AUJ72_06135 [Candidatus Omnitrophica bacterium CG1_02_46_14]
MKKLIVGILFCMGFSFFGVAYSMTPEEAKEAHFKEVKAVKEKQRAAREATKASSSANEKKAPGFWEKEGERSGLGGSGSRMGQFIKNLNPVPFFKEQREKYDARKN